MKKLLVIAMLSLSASIVNAQSQLKSIETIIEDPKADLQVVVYALNRCGGLYINLAGMAVSNSDQNAGNVLQKRSTLFFEKAFSAQLIRDKQTGRKVSDKKVLNEITESGRIFSEIYQKRLTENRLNTGYYVDAFIEADSQTCRVIANQLSIF